MGTSAFALENDWSFGQMLPRMKQMHPEFTDKQLEKMFQSCHAEDGPMQLDVSKREHAKYDE